MTAHALATGCCYKPTAVDAGACDALDVTQSFVVELQTPAWAGMQTLIQNLQLATKPVAWDIPCIYMHQLRANTCYSIATQKFKVNTAVGRPYSCPYYYHVIKHPNIAVHWSLCRCDPVIQASSRWSCTLLAILSTYVVVGEWVSKWALPLSGTF